MRADMDAPPLTEEKGQPYASSTRGRMHACGHDGHHGHVATLPATARTCSGQRDLDGTVRFIFQPAVSVLDFATIVDKYALAWQQ